MAPLLFWSLRYVDAFASDIFAARAELDRLEARRDALRAQDAGLDLRARRTLHRGRLADLLDRRRREGRGVPIWGTAHNGVLRRDPRTGCDTPPVNADLLYLHLGIDAVAEPASHIGLNAAAGPMLDAALAALDPETGGMDTPVAPVRESGAPWRPRFDAKSLALEERMLQAACYVVCAYLTGTRD